jgi:hypothetical protein
MLKAPRMMTISKTAATRKAMKSQTSIAPMRCRKEPLVQAVPALQLDNVGQVDVVVEAGVEADPAADRPKAAIISSRVK